MPNESSHGTGREGFNIFDLELFIEVVVDETIAIWL